MILSSIGPPIPVYRYTEYRDTTVNIGGIDTGIVLSNTVVFGIGNSASQQRHALQAPPPYNVRVAFRALLGPTAYVGHSQS